MVIYIHTGGGGRGREDKVISEEPSVSIFLPSFPLVHSLNRVFDLSQERAEHRIIMAYLFHQPKIKLIEKYFTWKRK